MGGREISGALLLLGVLVGAGCGDGAPDPQFDWGPAGQPEPIVGTLDDAVGDWIVCRDLRCRGIESEAFRLAEGGHARLVRSAVRSGRLTRCLDGTEEVLAWRYFDGILTLSIDPRSPDLRLRERREPSIAVRVEIEGDVVYWSPQDRRDIVDDLPVPSVSVEDGVSRQGLGILGPRRERIRVVRVPIPADTAECHVF